MYKPDFEEFKSYCSQGNIVPVYREYLADMDTPVSVLNRFAENKHVFLLESVEGGERWGRYSFLGVNPFALFKVQDGKAILRKNGHDEVVESPEGPLMALRKIIAQYKPVEMPGLPRFYAGAIGYIGHHTVNEFERLPAPKKALKQPTSHFILTDQVIIFDNVRHTIKIVACARLDEHPNPKEAYDTACARIAEIEKVLRSPAPVLTQAEPAAFDESSMSSNMTKEDYCDMVRKAKKYIEDGDVIQVVLSQRFSTRLTVKPIQLYRALRLINPSPYTFFLKFDDNQILVGSSPEVMVRLNNRTAELRPIAGTRPRGKTEQQDHELADELLKDVKERAEHLMLVDLGRNDLGRVAAPASVQVRDFMTVERYSHVMHLVSNIEAQVRDGKDAFDLIKATFPAGTLSGAPKIRALEIINELEPDSREIYGGAVGYFGFNGNMDTCITIRTLEIDGDKVSVQAGAGIVYDSDPETEYMETRHKARGMFKAIALAAANLEM
ncbi:MAG: anthranilate synthase component I [Victivallaceae bacterium]|jgi:anthranilate synthase component 1